MRSHPTQGRIVRSPKTPGAAAGPRRPGLLTRGSVEPLALSGVVALVLAMCLVAAATGLQWRGLAIAGLAFGIFGVLSIAVALLAALVRRERDLR